MTAEQEGSYLRPRECRKLIEEDIYRERISMILVFTGRQLLSSLGSLRAVIVSPPCLTLRIIVSPSPFSGFCPQINIQ